MEIENREEEKGVKEMLKEIINNQKGLVEEKKVRWWKIPWKARVTGRKAQKGWSTFMIINNNGEANFIKSQTKDGITIIDGFPRIATIDHKLSYRGKPLYIIPSWSMKPFSAVENYSETEKEKMNIAGRRAVLAVLETEKIKAKKDYGNLIWMVLGIIIVGAGYYFGKNAGWF